MLDGGRHLKMQALAEKLFADGRVAAAVYAIGSDDFEIAMLEEDSRGIIVWAQLRPFLHLYAKFFPMGPLPIPEAEIEAANVVLLDQGNFLLTPALLKRTLRGEVELGLGELASLRYPRSRVSSWDGYKEALTKIIFDHATLLQLWHVETITRPNTNNGGAIAGYRIKAGQALIDFNEYVYQPVRREQHRRFFRKFHSKLKDE